MLRTAKQRSPLDSQSRPPSSPRAPTAAAGSPTSAPPRVAESRLINRVKHAAPLAGGSPEARRQGALRSALLLSLVIFGIDIWLPAGLALGALYILPVLMSVWTARRRVTLIVAGLCSVLTPIGASVSLIRGPGAERLDSALTQVATTLSGIAGANPDSQIFLLTLLHISIAIFVIWVTTGLGMMRIEMERELLESRELTAVALRSSADGVITADASERVSYMNAVAERLTGWDLDAARGRRLTEVFRLEVDPETAQPGAALDEAGTNVPGRKLLVARDGARSPVEVSTAPIVDKERDLSGQVLILRDASDLAAYETRLRELAFRDRLTGLPNRTSLTERLDLELAHARRDDARLALLFLDLDQFKAVNDNFGHHAGDEMLRATAQRLLGCLREADTVARLGGDEFTVLIPHVQNAADAERVARKIVEALGRPILIEGQLLPIRPSIGIALFPDHADSPEELLRAADQAMYRAKGLGGSRYAMFAAERNVEVFPLFRDESGEESVPEDLERQSFT